MHRRGYWFVGAIVFALGGCIIAYPPGAYDDDSTTVAAASTSSSGEGGMGGSASTSSSSGGGSGGNGGSGGALCPMPDSLNCSAREANCLSDCFKLDWADRAGNAQDNFVKSVAIDTRGSVAIAGEYHNAPLAFEMTDTLTLPETEVLGTNFNEGFVAYYAFDGDPLKQVTWVKPLAPPSNVDATNRTARGLAFDGNNDLIVVGRETTNKRLNEHVFINKYPTGSGVSPIPMWTKTDIATEFTKTEAFAVATFGTNIYVFGRSEANAAELSCGNSGKFQEGIFVAKLAANGACQWLQSFNTSSMASVGPVAITARDADKNGVWITGISGSTIVLSDTPQSLSLSPTGQQPFVIGLADNDGAPLAGAFINHTQITPTGIETTGAGSGGTTTLFMSGMVTEPTSLVQLNPGQRAGFLLRLNVTGISGASAGTVTVDKSTLFVGTTPSSDARATGIASMNGKLYIAGAFSESLALPTNSTNATHSGMVPFLATMDALGENWLGFNVFGTGSDTPAFDLAELPIAASTSRVALAGGWVRDLDLTTPDKLVDGSLSRIGAVGSNHQLFVGRFSAP